jgi:hypothetical protein
MISFTPTPPEAICRLQQLYISVLGAARDFSFALFFTEHDLLSDTQQ